VIGDDETGFRGTGDAAYRTEAWEFILSGGGLYNNLDYSFVAGQEDGTFAYPASQPGGGNPKFRKQMKVLSEFIRDFDFIQMQPDTAAITSVSAGSAVHALVQPGKAMAIYVRSEKLAGSSTASLQVELAAGDWQAEWVDTKTGKVVGKQSVNGRRAVTLESPTFETDIALRLQMK
jgi:hypothetical protein